MLRHERHRMRMVLLGLALLGASALATRLAAADGGDALAAQAQQLLDSIPPEKRAQSDAYFEGGYWLQAWGTIVSVAVAWVLLRFGLARRMRDWAERRSRLRFVQGMLFFAPYVLVTAAITLPWDFYEGFIREQQYGLSTQTPVSWLTEHAIGLVVGMIGTCLVGALLYLGMRRLRQRWWVAAAAATPFLLFLLIVISPVFIAPLFNDYKPLPDSPTKDRILALARANGVPADDVYEVDASRQSTRISANVSGALGTVRISLNDNLLGQCTPEEVEAVTAHEIGHYVLNHTLRHVIYLSLVFAVAFAFAHGVFTVVARRWGRAWGVRGVEDFAGFPIIAAALSVFLFLTSPVQNAIIRSAEMEADLYGLNAARQPDAFAQVALKLATYRKLAPGPVEEAVFFDHPSGRTRILTALRWKAAMMAEPQP